MKNFFSKPYSLFYRTKINKNFGIASNDYFLFLPHDETGDKNDEFLMPSQKI
jgi:hypothetical protein